MNFYLFYPERNSILVWRHCCPVTSALSLALSFSLSFWNEFGYGLQVSFTPGYRLVYKLCSISVQCLGVFCWNFVWLVSVFNIREIDENRTRSLTWTVQRIQLYLREHRTLLVWFVLRFLSFRVAIVKTAGTGYSGFQVYSNPTRITDFTFQTRNAKSNWIIHVIFHRRYTVMICMRKYRV